MRLLYNLLGLKSRCPIISCCAIPGFWIIVLDNGIKVVDIRIKEVDIVIIEVDLGIIVLESGIKVVDTSHI